jgi:hypothetical protein
MKLYLSGICYAVEYLLFIFVLNLRIVTFTFYLFDCANSVTGYVDTALALKINN